jgi:hypothetical protein
MRYHPAFTPLNKKRIVMSYRRCSAKEKLIIPFLMGILKLRGLFFF